VSRVENLEVGSRGAFQSEECRPVDIEGLSEEEQVVLVSQQPARVMALQAVGDRVGRARRGRCRPVVELAPRRGEKVSRPDFDHEATAGERMPGFWLMGGVGQTVWEGALRVLGEEKATCSRHPHSSCPFLAPL